MFLTNEILFQIKTIRKTKKISQSQMAKVLMIDQSVYSKIENKQIELTLDRLLEICYFLQVSIDIRIN